MLRAALVGASVTIACVLIPVVHFLTAVPSPLIGGYIAGARVACTPAAAVKIAVLMGSMLIIPVFGIVLSASLFTELPMIWGLALGTGLVMWFVLGGALGAMLGGAATRRQLAQPN